MTDDLRTRIAAITASLIREEIDIDPVWLVAQHVADAVIRELGLEREKELDEENGLLTLTRRHRYVTDWTPE